MPLMMAIACTNLQAQDMKKLFTLDDLLPGGSTYYESSVPENRYYGWWGSHCIHLGLEQCAEIDAETGKEDHALFRLDDINRALRQAGLTAIHHLMDTTFPYDQEPLALIQTTHHRALVDWQQQQVVWSQPIATPDQPAEVEDWNSTSRALAYVSGHNLYVTDGEGNTRAISDDGSLDITYGESVHRDEFGITKGTFWSQDGQKLAFYRMDQTAVSTYPQVDITPTPTETDPSRCARLVPDKYPMAGETSHRVTVGIYDVQAHTTVYLKTGDPTDRYFTNIAWASDSKSLFLIELNRDQNHATLDQYDAVSGEKLATLFEERNEKYVEPLEPIQFLPWDDSQFVYLTRNRCGYNHIYLYQLKKGKCILRKQLTSGTWEVIDFVGFDKTNRRLIYTSNEANPIGKAVYAVDTNGHRQRIGTADGWHSPLLSPVGGRLIDNWSSPTVARQIDLLSTLHASHSTLHTSPDPWDRFRVPDMQVGTIKGADGQTDLYYRLVLPTDFDPTKKYPAIVYVYGGPHAHNVDASRHNGVRGWDIWMAQQGYVMFCLDNRGSEHRGLDFEQATFRQLGVEEMKDQLKGVEFLKSLPYVDADRLGIHGWSYGGFMTTSLMTTYPEVFKVGVAGGPVIDWKYYEAMYGERYMDTPQTNPDGYATTSLLGKADRLQGRLLLIYGGNDPTCVPQHTLSFIRACIDAGTHPDLFTYPGDGHNMFGTDRIHLHEHISRYFDDHLK